MFKLQKRLGILAAWPFVEQEGQFYLQSFWVSYIEEISALFSHVTLIVPVLRVSSQYDVSNWTLMPCDNCSIERLPHLPPIGTYKASMRNIRHYFRAVKKVAPTVDCFYVRAPDPFCWLPKLTTKTPTIMHFVGDSIDTTRRSNRSFISRYAKILAYLPEYFFTLWAARQSIVYANGKPLAQKLWKASIDATPVISSTIRDDNLLIRSQRKDRDGILKLLYVGFLRPGKRIDLIIDAVSILAEQDIAFRLDIVGGGESQKELQNLVRELNLMDHVQFHGHVDQRSKLLEYYGKADLYILMSASEGSPRTVLEAMAANCAVISTPVGSLPDIFENGEEIYFAAHSSADLAAKLIEIAADKEQIKTIAEAGHLKVKSNFMMTDFIKKLFSKIGS